MTKPSVVDEREDVTRAIFESEIVPAYTPVVLRGIAAEWPAVAAARTGARALAEYVGRRATDRPVEIFLGAPEMRGRFFYTPDLSGFNFERRQVQLTSLLAKLLEIAPLTPPPMHLYAGGIASADHVPVFAADHPMPLVPAEVLPRLWIGNATAVAPHYDLGRNIAVCVAGTRRFTLFPPEQTRNLYVGPIERTIAGQPASLVDPDAPDLARFPRYAEALAACRVAELGPGDAIYVPPLWWHAVRTPGPFGMLVNYWWGQSADSSPFEALIHGLLAIRDLPAPERAAWRSVFDHYVFTPEPPTHLPPSARGALGPPSDARSAMIRSFLLGSLGRR